jgi:hypothetical protein
MENDDNLEIAKFIASLPDREERSRFGQFSEPLGVGRDYGTDHGLAL